MQRSKLETVENKMNNNLVYLVRMKRIYGMCAIKETLDNSFRQITLFFDCVEYVIFIALV